MAKYKCPEGVTSVSIGGEQYDADKNGFITVQDDGRAQLLGAAFACVPGSDAVDDAPVIKEVKADK